MAGAGRGSDVTRPPTQGRAWRPPRHQAPSLPLDVVLAIAARTDEPTLVRCAATCADARRRLADDDPANLRARLRLRHADGRFVLPLLRGDLVHVHDSYRRTSDMYMVDARRMRRVTTGGVPLASRDGLLLLRMAKELRVCDPATGRSQAIPLPPESLPVDVRYGKYVLLVGGDGGDDEDDDGGAGAILGQPFQVLLADIELSQHRRYLRFQTFSPARRAWSRCTEIRTPNLQGSRLQQGLGKALVVGGAVHWLCLADTGAYALKLHVRAAQVTVTMLPDSVPHNQYSWWHEPLLATSSAGGSPVVLAVYGNKILAWAQSKQTAKWKPQPQVVVEAEAMLWFLDGAGGTRPSVWTRLELQLEWFAERSGAVLIRMSHEHFFWLDLQSMEIIRWFSDSKIGYGSQHWPYEMNLSDWVPTFNTSTV
ncbi:hypothetical protein C2845_PM03G15460 [Panicum miliaceum]|uniref:DUF7595 domain-containing protein n=1 Tax=Panicum miliaceum TaxID=4540 RepID=A0A3L6TFN9_PANMI|nr:hypothetical protein C2845_PM03G15460 [Panicum miliaceum]